MCRASSRALRTYFFELALRRVPNNNNTPAGKRPPGRDWHVPPPEVAHDVTCRPSSPAEVAAGHVALAPHRSAHVACRERIATTPQLADSGGRASSQGGSRRVAGIRTDATGGSMAQGCCGVLASRDRHRVDAPHGSHRHLCEQENRINKYLPVGDIGVSMFCWFVQNSHGERRLDNSGREVVSGMIPLLVHESAETKTANVPGNVIGGTLPRRGRDVDLYGKPTANSIYLKASTVGISSTWRMIFPGECRRRGWSSQVMQTPSEGEGRAVVVQGDAVNAGGVGGRHRRVE